jgi:hypothetical protein
LVDALERAPTFTDPDARMHRGTILEILETRGATMTGRAAELTSDDLQKLANAVYELGHLVDQMNEPRRAGPRLP